MFCIITSIKNYEYLGLAPWTSDLTEPLLNLNLHPNPKNSYQHYFNYLSARPFCASKRPRAALSVSAPKPIILESLDWVSSEEKREKKGGGEF